MNGAWIALIGNIVVALIGVLQAADWINLVGSQKAGLIAALLAGVNAIAHAVTPAGPASPSIPPPGPSPIVPKR